MKEMPEMFLPEVKNSSRTRSYLKTALLFILSPVQPVLLEVHHLQTAEEARELAQNYNIEAIQKKRQSRNIQKQITSFGRIELGSYINKGFDYNLCFTVLCFHSVSIFIQFNMYMYQYHEFNIVLL